MGSSQTAGEQRSRRTQERLIKEREKQGEREIDGEETIVKKLKDRLEETEGKLETGGFAAGLKCEEEL